MPTQKTMQTIDAPMQEVKSILQKVLEIQKIAKVAKGEQAKNYTYRNIDDLYEVIAPKLDELNLLIKFDEEVVINDRAFVNCQMTLTDVDTGEVLATTSVSEVPINPGIMSSQQATKAATTFARKQCLEAMFRVTSPDEVPEGIGQNIPLPKGKNGSQTYFG